MGEYQVFALDWGISLRTEQKVELDMTHIAIRGHWIRPSEKAGENCLVFEAAEYVETTFEHQYLVKVREWKTGQFSGGCARKKVLRTSMIRTCRNISIFHLNT